MLRRALSHQPQEISKEQFNDWKRHKVTEALIFEIALQLIDFISDPLPTDSIDRSLIMAHQREGFRMFMEQLLEWKPEHVRKLEAGDRKEGEDD